MTECSHRWVVKGGQGTPYGYNKQGELLGALQDEMVYFCTECGKNILDKGYKSIGEEVQMISGEKAKEIVDRLREKATDMFIVKRYLDIDSAKARCKESVEHNLKVIDAIRIGAMEIPSSEIMELYDKEKK